MILCFPEKSISEIREEITVSSQNASGDGSSSDETQQQPPRTATSVPPVQRARSETPGSEKIQLLRKQMEQNRLKMAEREHSKRGIEELVTQLKAKFDSNQMTLEKSSHLGRSIGDLSVLSPATQKYQSASDLSQSTISFDKDRIRYLEKKVQQLELEIKTKEKDFLHRDPESEHHQTIKNLENKILDYEEHLKEKECIIEARTQAVSLLSENMSMKGKNTVDLLEDTKQEMYKMQQKFIEAESTYKTEIDNLKAEIQSKNDKIANMEEINDILETARYDLTIKNSTLETQLQDVQEYSTKLNELNRLNESLQHRITELENSSHTTDEPETTPLDTLQVQFNQLQIENDDLKKSLQHDEVPATDGELNDRLKSLEANLKQQQDIINEQHQSQQQLENSLQEKTIEYNVLNANFSVLQEKLKSTAPKSLFSMSTDEEAEAEITKLKAQLDDANKSMIKMKLKAKQLQKQVDTIKKSSDVSKQIIVLTEQNTILQSRVTELETATKSADNPPSESDLGKRVQVLETTCQNQITAMRLLEEQKLDMTEDLHSTKDELTLLRDQIKSVDSDEETARVQSHMDSIAQEERLAEALLKIKQLQEEIEMITNERNEIKLFNNYMAENIEQGSSAESIEIVENLTQQEKQEMEELQQSMQHREEVYGQNMMSQDLSESLVKLREESSELMHKIEMFTNERHEVLDKMEVLTAENLKLQKEIDVLKQSKDELDRNCTKINEEKSRLEQLIKDGELERKELQKNIKELTENRNELKEEINTLIQASSTTPDSEEITFDKDPYVKCLKNVEVHMENYRRGKDKNAKFEVSKKLTKEAKNMHELATKLLSDYEQCLEKFNELRCEYAQKVHAQSSEYSATRKLQVQQLENELDVCKQDLQTLQDQFSLQKQETER